MEDGESVLHPVVLFRKQQAFVLCDRFERDRDLGDDIFNGLGRGRVERYGRTTSRPIRDTGRMNRTTHA
jgi:hypothetical protein